MRTVSRYLLREFLLASGAVFLAVLVTWLAADSLLNLDRFAGDSSQGLRELFLRSLDLVALGVPLSCLAGVVWSLTRAVRNREITAIRCGGIPLRSALIPLLVASAVIAASIGIFEDRVLMPARQAINRAALGEEGDAPRPRKILDHWWYTNGSSVFSAQSYDPQKRKLSGVTVFSFDDERSIRERIDARSATNVEGNAWEFRSALVRSFGADGQLERREVLALRVDLGLSSSDMERATPPVNATTLHKLARAIREHHGDLKDLAGLETSFHSRLAQPFAVLILVLLAIPFAIGDVERGDSLPRALLASIGCAGVYWTFWTAGQLTGQSGLLPAFAPIWGVTLAALGIGLYRYRQITE